MAKLYTPIRYVSSDDPEGFTALDSQGWGLRSRLSANGRGVSSYMIQPGNIGFDSLGMSVPAEGLEPAVIKAVGIALDRIHELRVHTNAADRSTERPMSTYNRYTAASVGYDKDERSLRFGSSAKPWAPSAISRRASIRISTIATSSWASFPFCCARGKRKSCADA